MSQGDFWLLNPNPNPNPNPNSTPTIITSGQTKAHYVLASSLCLLCQKLEGLRKPEPGMR